MVKKLYSELLARDVGAGWDEANVSAQAVSDRRNAIEAFVVREFADEVDCDCRAALIWDRERVEVWRPDTGSWYGADAEVVGSKLKGLICDRIRGLPDKPPSSLQAS